MNTAQRMLQSINAQLTTLTATAKLLLGALMVILVMSLLLVANFAGRPSMVALPLNLDADGRASALAYIEQASIPYQERDGRLYVPAEQKYTVLGQLTGGDVISGDKVDFDKLIEQDSAFLTRDQNDRRWLIAKMGVLSRLISRFDHIERADVVIDIPRQAGYGRARVKPSASVTVTPRGEGLGSGQVEAIAQLVAGSQPGLSASDVRVIDSRSGLAHSAPDPADRHASQNLEIKEATEDNIHAKIERHLDYIPNVRVAVNAQVDTRLVQQRIDSYEDPKQGLLESESRTTETLSQSTGAEPGMRANIGAQISGGGARGTQTTDEQNRERSQPKFPTDAQEIHDSKGYALKVGATIGVPRSYFVVKYRLDRNEPEATPDDTMLEPVVTAESERIRRSVEPLVDTQALPGGAPGSVFVSMIPDFIAAAMPVGPGGGGGGRGVPQGFGGGGGGGSPMAFGLPMDLLKTLGLLGLSLLSLAMMFLMVRKAGAQTALPSAEEIVGSPPPLPTDESEVVGEAEESAPALEGLELDDTALRRKEMLTQVSDMVKQNPDEVANLLRRWIRVEA